MSVMLKQDKDAKLMLLSPRQPSNGESFYPAGEGGAAYCRNMCVRKYGTVEPMYGPLNLFSTPERPIYADTRGAFTNVFTTDGVGNLRKRMVMTSEGGYEIVDKPICRIARGECDAARTGDFLVFKDSSGALHYTVWSPSTGDYVNPGSVPQEVKFEVEAVSDGVTRAEVDAIEFRHPVADFREGVGEEVATQCRSAVERGFERLDALMAAAGSFASPVIVRVALRMWDGTLLALSEPRPVAPTHFCPTRRVSLNLISGNGGFTGTARTTIAAEGYHLRVRLDRSSLGGWDRLVPRVEVWVSSIDNPAYGSGEWQTTYTTADNRLHVVPPFVAEEVLAHRLVATEPAMLQRIVSTGASITEVRRNDSEKQKAVWEEPCARMWSRADAICGHGAFLHLAGAGSLRPEPPLPLGEPGATEHATCRVIVELQTENGTVHVGREAEITADGGAILPLLWYPDRRATRMTVALKYADGAIYSGEVPLVAATTGEDAAYFVSALSPAMQLAAGSSFPTLPDPAVEYSGSGSITTFRRGNPVVKVCETTSVGGGIRAIAAQPSGGGAYTRQFIYLFTDNGIVALTHDMNGIHVNCRPVSAQVVADRHRVAPTEKGVYALSENGVLVKLADAKVERLVMGLADYALVAYCRSTEELWFFAQAEGAETADSLVVDTGLSLGGDTYATMSSVTASYAVKAADGLIIESRTGAFSRLQYYGRSCEQRGERLTAVWVSEVHECPSGGVAYAGAMMHGECSESTMEIRLWPELPEATDFTLPPSERGELLIRGTLREHVGSRVSLPMLLPDSDSLSSPRQFPVSVVIRGKTPRIYQSYVRQNDSVRYPG